MYTLLRSQSVGTLLVTQAPALLISFVIAEMFFKWKSFTLECLGFLATWFIVDAVISTTRDLLSKPRDG
jgi:hypothetical protein